MNDASEREANAESIRQIPFNELPDRAARAELVRRALAGQDVYSYIPCASDHCVVWVRQPHPSIEARFLPMQWARLWHSGLQPDTVVVEEEHDVLETPGMSAPPDVDQPPQRQQRRQRRHQGYKEHRHQRRWVTWLSVLLLGISVLTGCNMGPTPDAPPPRAVVAPPRAPHRGPLFIQISADITGSYPRSLQLTFLEQMADWVDKLPKANSDGATVYVTYINSQPYAPASTPLSITIPAVANWPQAPQPTPVPSCPDNPYSCSAAQETVTTANSNATAQYQSALTTVQAQLAAVETQTKQQTQKLRALRPGVDNRATSIWGVLNLAAQRFTGVNGEKWLLVASDMANNTAIDEIPANLSGVHVLVLYLFCTSAVTCQNTKATWAEIFKKAHAASWDFLDPGQSKNATSPWS